MNKHNQPMVVASQKQKQKGCSIGGAGRGGVGTASKQDERAPLTPLEDTTLKKRRAGNVATPSRLLTPNGKLAVTHFLQFVGFSR